MSIRDFAAYLGVSERMVSKWEAGGRIITPRPFNQQLLDICLERCSPEERGRFALRVQPVTTAGAAYYKPHPTAVVQRCLARDDMRQALATRDIAAIFRILSAYGMPQRQIAAMTEQSQSEISEILAGRTVIAYDLLARIADGLGIPRGYMGLAYDESTAPLVGAGVRGGSR
jgi:transcriptional regulator with XRE-family HTH domain